MKEKPIYALPSADRRYEAEQYAGRRCTIDVRPFRDNDNHHNHVLTGHIIGVAVPNVGTVADMLIIKLDDPGEYLRALSLATVHSIEVA